MTRWFAQCMIRAGLLDDSRRMFRAETGMIRALMMIRARFFVMYLLKYLLIIYNYVIKGFPNLEIRSRDRRTHPLRGHFIIPMQGGSVVYVCTNFEAASSIRSKVIRWSQNLEIGSHDPKPRPFWTWTLNLCRNPSTHTYCQILCFHLDPLQSNGWKQCEWAILKAKFAMRMRRVMWLGGRGSSKTTYLESMTPICLFTT